MRVITTSVKDDHLRVLWGEIGRFIDTCAVPLKHQQGGPLIVKHREVRKVTGRWGREELSDTDGSTLPPGTVCTISYLLGMVSEKGEGLAGHHAAHTLCIVDEASGVDGLVYEMQQGWARKLLAIGNPNPVSESQWFRKGVEAGNLAAP